MLRFLALLVLMCSVCYGQGNSVGKGGDTIFCRPSPLNSFSGRYTLDYLLESNSGPLKIVPVTSFDQTVLRLSTFFTLHFPELKDSFSEYVEGVRKESETHSRIWIQAPGPLLDIKDESIIKQIPGNCLETEAGSTVLRLHQTVIRKSQFDLIEYHFDSGILSFQETNNPLQYSFFLVHEWMWDFTRDIETLRKLNWILHSDKLSNLSWELLSKSKFGILDLPLCERSMVVKDLFQKSCESINRADLLEVTEASLDYSHKLTRAGDLFGFNKLQTLTLIGVNYFPPRFFHSLYSLEVLDLTETRITSLPTSVLVDLKLLKELKISQEMFLTEGVFENLRRELKSTKITIGI